MRVLWSDTRLLLHCAIGAIASVALAIALLRFFPWTTLGAHLGTGVQAWMNGLVNHPWAYFGSLVALLGFGLCLCQNVDRVASVPHQRRLDQVGALAVGLAVLAGVSGGLVWGTAQWGSSGANSLEGFQARAVTKAYHQAVGIEWGRDPLITSDWWPDMGGALDGLLRWWDLDPDRPDRPGLILLDTDDTRHTLLVRIQVNQGDCRSAPAEVEGFVPVAINGRPIQGERHCDRAFDNEMRWEAVLTPTPDDQVLRDLNARIHAREVADCEKAFRAVHQTHQCGA